MIFNSDYSKHFSFILFNDAYSIQLNPLFFVHRIFSNTNLLIVVLLIAAVACVVAAAAGTIAFRRQIKATVDDEDYNSVPLSQIGGAAAGGDVKREKLAAQAKSKTIDWNNLIPVVALGALLLVFAVISAVLLGNQAITEARILMPVSR